MDSQSLQHIQLGELFSYTEDRGIVHLSDAQAKVSCDFTEGKACNSCMTDYLKRHFNQEVHLEGLRKLRRIQQGSGINHLLESNTDRKST